MVERASEKKHAFSLTVLGRTLEHLGVQMYKRREVAIAELVANAWDAGATRVGISIPAAAAYDPTAAAITIEDNGAGMGQAEIQDAYLVVGRNRRQENGGAAQKRPVMGRKGIGKLAGFGLAQVMTVASWKGGVEVELDLDVEKLKVLDNTAKDISVPGVIRPVGSRGSKHGTLVTLRKLKHRTRLEPEVLEEALARRFSNRVRGEMIISLNGKAIREPNIDIDDRIPKKNFKTEKLNDGNEVKYWYAYSKDVLQRKDLRGFTILVRGKTAQAPPFFFDVEGTASGQHGTRYVHGTIEADFVDAGDDDGSDIISTDRQEIDWEAAAAQALREWGQKLTRKALIDWVEMRGKKALKVAHTDEALQKRLDRLDATSRKQVERLLQSIGQISAEDSRIRDLADSVLRAYEFRQFHDLIVSIEAVADDPNQLEQLLSHIREWRVLESRAVLEIIKGRLDIVDKFHVLVVDDAPETASRVGKDNVHDLIARYPWLLHPEWQVLAEEKTITKQLREWNAREVPSKVDQGRYDFLALSSDDRLVVVEIKRSGHAPSLEELQRLERYKDKLSRARKGDLHMVFVSGDKFNIDDKGTEKFWHERSDASLWTWAEVHERVRRHYEHYRAVLEADPDHGDFRRKEAEVQQTREVLASGSVFRGKNVRRGGLGPQDSRPAGSKNRSKAARPGAKRK